MSGKPGTNRTPTASLFPPLALCLLSGLFGFMPVKLLFGVEFVTCGIFAFAATALFGPGWGLAAAAAGALPTWTYWGHPYAVPVFLAEAAVSAWLTRRRGMALTPSVMVFWLAPGPLMAWAVYGLVLHVPQESALFVVLKMGLNGIGSAAAASLLIPLLKWLAGRSRSPGAAVLSLTQLLANLMLAILLAAILSQMTLMSRRQVGDAEAAVAAKLEADAGLIARTLNGTDGGPDRREFDSLALRYPEYKLRILDTKAPGLKPGDEAVREPLPSYLEGAAGTGSIRTVREGVQVWMPSLDPTGSKIRQRMQSVYFTSAEWGADNRFRISAELAAGPLWSGIYQDISANMVLAYILAVLAAAVVFTVCGRLTRPLMELSRLSGEFASRMGSGFRPPWPSSRFSEIGTLSDSFRRMADELNRQFERMELRQHQLARHAADASVELDREKERAGVQRGITQSILEATREGMLLCGTDGRILFANSRLKDFFGVCFPEGSAVGNIFAGLPGLDRAFAERLIADLHDFLQQGEGETPFRRTFSYTVGEQVFHYSLYAAPASGDGSGPEAGRLFVFRDRTEEVQQETLKEDMINQISHELRTPLTSILGFSEIMNNRELPPARQKQYTSTIYNEAVRLSRLVDDFLDLQRMESGNQRYFCVPHDMRELAVRAVDRWRLENRRPLGLELPEEPAYLLADADRIVQALDNLVGNAVKYSPEGSPVTLTVRKDQGMVYVDVADEGLGIPEKDKARVFGKFYRVEHPDRRKIGGSGLGLAIVKEIVEAHRGEITFISKHGEGSVFSLWMPAYRAPDTTDGLLLIERDAELAESLSASLPQQGVKVLRLDSFEEALFALREGQGGAPRYIAAGLVGAGLLNGLEFAAALRHTPARRTPLFFLESLERNTPPGVQSWAGTLTSKPFAAEALTGLIRAGGQQADKRFRCYFPMQDPSVLTAQLAKFGLFPERLDRDGIGLTAVFPEEE